MFLITGLISTQFGTVETPQSLAAQLARLAASHHAVSLQLNRFEFSQRGWFKTVNMIVYIFTFTDFFSARFRTSQIALCNRSKRYIQLFVNAVFPFLLMYTWLILFVSVLNWHLYCPAFSLHKLYCCFLFLQPALWVNDLGGCMACQV